MSFETWRKKLNQVINHSCTVSSYKPQIYITCFVENLDWQRNLSRIIKIKLKKEKKEVFTRNETQ